MKTAYALPLTAALSFALLGACSKPAPAVEQATTATADAGGVADPGGAVSPPQANGAVNTDANATVSDVAPASNSFTEGQAKGHIENAGYSNVTSLMKTPDGMWTAKATKGGKTMDVAVDFKGAVTTR